MKKVLLILILFLSCYFIYNKTSDKKIYYLTIGDSLSRGTNEYGIVSYGYNEYVKDYLEENNKLEGFNKTFTDNDYRIMDIIKILEYNEIKDNSSLNRLIKKADIITISLGMNEIYYKLQKSNQNIYTYIDNMIKNYDKLLNYINKFHHDKVFVLGYYNVLEKKDDIFTYANYKLQEICKKYNYIYVDLSNIFTNNPNYIEKKDGFTPNNAGYEKISQIIVEKLKNNWYNIPCNFITMTFSHGGRREKNAKKYSSKLCKSNCNLCLWRKIWNRINKRKYPSWSMFKMSSILYRKTKLRN